MAGTKFDFTGVTYGEVFAGLLSQDYDDAALKSIDAFNYGAEITWNSTLLMTVTGLIKRSLQETTLDGGMSRLLLKLVQQALLVEQATQRWPAVQVRG